MSKMMAQWLQKAKPGDKGLTRPPASARVSEHKNEVRSMDRGFFQIQFRVTSDECFHGTVHTPHGHKRNTQLTH